MAQELSGTTIIIFIACGVLTLILLFIFAKRQIARFTLKSHRGPHVMIGSDAPKFLYRDIHNRIDRVTEIQYEPQVLTKTEEAKYADEQTSYLPAHYYRMKVVDALFVLEKEIRERQPTLKRRPGDNLRKFLLDLLNGPLQGASSRLVHQFCDSYDHARHDPREFGPEEYKVYMELLTQLIQCTRRTFEKPANSERTNPKCSNFNCNASLNSVQNGKQISIIQRPLSLGSVRTSHETEV